MKQAIAGVTPAEMQEATVMMVWPSVSAYSSGRFLGRLYDLRWPDVYFFRLGHILALFSIPHALILYFLRVLPRIGVRYRLTNRRIVVQRGLAGVDDRALELDQFDAIQVDVRLGQRWFDAGDLVFLRQGAEVFRLEGVSRPEAFRQTCWKSHTAYVGVQRLSGGQKASA
jgi:hypothetical protein